MTETLTFAAAVLLGSFVSGLSGLGGGILLLAFMTPLFPPAVLIPLHGTIQLFSNISRVALAPGKIHGGIFLTFGAGAALGALLGMPLRVDIPPAALTVVLAAAILFFTWAPGMKRPLDFKGKFFAVGAAASFLSLFVGSTGPLTAPFFINSELTRESFVPTKASCQIPLHLFKVVVYVLSGFLLAEWIPEIVLAVPLVFAGNYIGKAAGGRFSEEKYRIFIKGLITLLVVRMLVKLVL